MLGRHMLGYIPSLVVPGLASFASLYFFTRLLQPDSYGHYVLAINVMSMLVGVGFFWLQSAASRLLPQAVEAGNEDRLTATLYCLQVASSLSLIFVAALIIILLPLGDWRVAVWFAPPLAIFRAMLNLNQAYHRNFLRIARYNVIEVGQAVLGLALAIILIAPLCLNASGAALGTLLGLAIMAAYDWRMLAAIKWRAFDRGMFREIAVFGLPFVVNYGLSFVLSRSDSFLIQYFHGAAEVGIYNAGYAFPDRVGQYLFMAVATASFPLTVRRLEQEGPEAARDQTYINGIAMLALVIPACVGLLFANDAIVATMIGKEFSAGAMRIMPWITLATVLNGLAAHYFDHSLHLAKRTGLFFVTLGPAAVLNFLGNLWAIPRFGYMGAAYTTLAAYALYLTLSIIVGARVFPIKFPFKPALHICLSTAAMAVALYLGDFSKTPLGLIDLVVTGTLVYGAGLLIFNVADMRSLALAQLRRLVAPTASPFLHSELVTTPQAFTALAPAWDALYRAHNRGVFGSHAWFDTWWRHLGSKSGGQLQLIVIRDVKGELKAVLPLVVRRAKGVSVAEWAGHEVFDFGDVLAADEGAAREAFHAARRLGRYDILLLKEVHAQAAARVYLDTASAQRAPRRNYFLNLDFASGEAWLAAQSRKLRGDTRRKTEKMQAQGAVTFQVYRQGDVFPDAVLDALYAQKAAWFAARKESGVFARPEVKGFLRDLAYKVAAEGQLYLAWLTCGEKIVACHLGFIHHGVLHLYHTTYDAAFGAFSPGNALMIETIKWAIDARLHELDFMRGDESYKARFASGERVLSTYVSARTLLGRLALSFHAPRQDDVKPDEETPGVV